MSVYMNNMGDKKYIPETVYCNGLEVPFFRKSLHEGSFYEKDIVSLIHTKQNQDNTFNVLVRIFKVTDIYYNAELLDLDHSDKSTMLNDIHESLRKLHSLNIIYIDLKEDNIGYSHIDKRWKIFDFDVSGLSNDSFTEWVKEPPFYYAYKTAFKKYFQLSKDTLYIKKDGNEVLPLTKIDDIIYNTWKLKYVSCEPNVHDIQVD